MNLVIKGQRDGLDAVARDQQVAVSPRIAAIGNADPDAVDLPCVHRRFERQRASEAVHLGVVLIGGVVEIKVLTRGAIDLIGRHIPRHGDRQRHKSAVDPDAKAVVHASVDVFGIFFRRKDELHRQIVAVGYEIGREDCAVKAGHPGNGVQIGIAVDARSIRPGVAALVGVARSVRIGEAADSAGRQDHPGIRTAHPRHDRIGTTIDARRRRIAAIGCRDDLNAIAKDDIGHRKGCDIAVDGQFGCRRHVATLTMSLPLHRQTCTAATTAASRVCVLCHASTDRRTDGDPFIVGCSPARGRNAGGLRRECGPI